MQKFKSVKDILGTLNDEKSCREFLEDTRWNGTPKYPHCDTESATHYRLTRNGEFHGKYKCRHCRNTFTVIVGTMFEGTHIASSIGINKISAIGHFTYKTRNSHRRYRLIHRKLVYLHVLRDDMFNRRRLVLFSSVNLDNSYCVESQAKTLPLVRV